jgi:hypothetical protein
MTVLLKKGGFSGAEVQEILEFTAAGGIDTAYLPGHELDTLLEKFIREPGKKRFIRDFDFNIALTTDDNAYSFNFSRWSDTLLRSPVDTSIGRVSGGDPGHLFLQLGFRSMMAFLLVILPMLIFRIKTVPLAGLPRFSTYFACLGLGFMCVEISLMQKLTLFLGHPIYSITATLFALLVFTGLGSLFSGRWCTPGSVLLWCVPAGAAAAVHGYPVRPLMVEHLMGLALPVIYVQQLQPYGNVLLGFCAGVSFFVG